MLYITPIVIKRIVNQLLARGKLTLSQSKDYIARIANENIGVLEQIIEKNESDDNEIAAIVAETFNLSVVNMKALQGYQIAFPAVPSEFLIKNQVIPFHKESTQAHVAFVDPSKAVLTNALQKVLGCSNIKFFIAKIGDTKTLLELISNHSLLDDQIPSDHLDSAVHKLDYQSSSVVINAGKSQVATQTLNVDTEKSAIHLAQEIILEAVDKKASDVHIEPLLDKKSRVCFRINGVLSRQEQFDEVLTPIYDQVISRFKVLAHCDVSEHRLPQDGSFVFHPDSIEQSIDLRFSVINTQHGERVVIRILSANFAANIDSLGLGKANQDLLLNAINLNQGMVLVTGPTGSGKTTTLYSALRHLNDGSKSIFSVEDPIEYTIEGVAQCQVQPKIDLNFSSYLRSFLRQDPEVILVGEIRDQETVDMAIKSALTGHLILSTLHTNNSIGTIDRLRDLGVDDFLIAYALNLVIAQRLVRQNCPNCIQTDVSVSSDLLKSLFHEILAGTIEAKSSKGCPRCQYTGYLDRIPMFEFLPFDDDIRLMIIQKVSQQEIIAHLEYLGLPRFKQQAIKLIQAGSLSIKEYQRVIA